MRWPVWWGFVYKLFTKLYHIDPVHYLTLPEKSTSHTKRATLNLFKEENIKHKALNRGNILMRLKLVVWKFMTLFLLVFFPLRLFSNAVGEYPLKFQKANWNLLSES